MIFLFPESPIRCYKEWDSRLNNIKNNSMPFLIQITNYTLVMLGGKHTFLIGVAKTLMMFKTRGC